jgi:hypothetical protein
MSVDSARTTTSESRGPSSAFGSAGEKAQGAIPTLQASLGNAAIAQLHSSGNRLDGPVRARMEGAFGADFSDVRVHRDNDANQASESMRARAFTVGQDIYFGRNMYAPDTGNGLKLLAHELTHTLQQPSSGGSPAAESLDVSRPDHASEREAANLAERVVGNLPVAGARAPASALIQRQDDPNAGPAPQVAPTPAPATDPGQTPAAATSAAVGVPTSGHELRAEATIPANVELSRSPTSDPSRTNVIHTEEATQVVLTVESSGITINFAPDLVVTNHSSGTLSPDFNVWVTSVRWDFSSQQITVNGSARGITWLANLGNPIQNVSDGLASFVSKNLPARMLVKGYDPFADPAILTDLATFGGSRSGGPPAVAPVVPFARLSASFTLGADVTQTAGAGSIVIPSGSRIELSVSGKSPGTAAGPQIDEVSMTIGRAGADVNLRAFGSDLPLLTLQGVALHHGGALSFQYTVVTEDLEFLVRALLASAVVQSGHGGELGSGALDARQPRIHAIIDSEVRPRLEPMLRDFIIANRGAIPGIDLANSLGIGPAPPAKP